MIVHTRDIADEKCGQIYRALVEQNHQLTYNGLTTLNHIRSAIGFLGSNIAKIQKKARKFSNAFLKSKAASKRLRRFSQFKQSSKFLKLARRKKSRRSERNLRSFPF